jgi:tRNA-Thr(GGU) m(6)t(6)A37 methyltransferase TsaA
MSRPPDATDEFAARPGESAIELPEAFDDVLYFIGTIHTPWRTREECPKNPRESKGAICTIEVDNRYAAGLAGIEAFTHIVVLYFMNRARRDLVIQVPRHLGLARGTFALRSPVRPNPIALSVAKLLKVEANRLSVVGLDCLDGTPLLDIKPYLPAIDAIGPDAPPTKK